MAKRKKTRKKDEEAPVLVGVDYNLGLYELTDQFHAYNKYHNEDCMVDYTTFATNATGDTVTPIQRTIPRFGSLRRLEAARLGSRPFMGGVGATSSKPNVNLGHMRLMLDYLTLPFKSVFTDSNIVQVRMDKRQYTEAKLSEERQEEEKLQTKDKPFLASNKEITDDVSDAYADVLRRSKKMRRVFDISPRRVAQDGLMAYLHSDIDWPVEPINALDLVTEPQADYDPATWGSFFVIKKMTAQEVVDHINSPGMYWNEKALRWALESSRNNRGIIDGHHNTSGDHTNVSGENFSVKSFYSDKSSRVNNIGSYYGNMHVVEAYYKNKDGKVNKAIFFPSIDHQNISASDKARRASILSRDRDLTKGISEKEIQDVIDMEFADILFERTDVFDSMEEAITVIPFDRSEPSLERQRAYGHELFSPIEILMRLDAALLNITMFLATPMVRNRSEGADGQSLLDLDIELDGSWQDIGDRDFVEVPFRGDLKAMLAIRSFISSHISAKAFLGGLDGGETSGNQQGKNLANLRLIRDGRIHKHTVEDFSEGFTELFTKMFKKILDMKTNPLTSDDVLLQKTFYDRLFNVYEYDEDIFEYEKEDIVPDTNLPYWMEVSSVRNGASHFGSAELVLYSEIKQVFGDGLTQDSLQKLNRMGIKSLLGSHDALDILGDPKDAIVTEQDQIYMATNENVMLLGSVSAGDVNFEKILVRSDKDDHKAHLQQVHLPKAQELIQRLEESEVSPQEMQNMSEQDLGTRNQLILKVGALANHITLHQQNLDRFGSGRDDINRLKEETNAVIQSAEGLINSLQISLRAQKQKQDETAARLQNISPENEVEKAKQQTEQMKLQAQMRRDDGQLALANRIADDSKQQHIDGQITKARDRNAKINSDKADAALKREEIQSKEAIAARNEQNKDKQKK